MLLKGYLKPESNLIKVMAGMEFIPELVGKIDPAVLEVATQEQYLMVLGAPGMGKTTFLRKVGLEALKRNQGDYTPNCIPVLLEMNYYDRNRSLPPPRKSDRI